MPRRVVIMMLQPLGWCPPGVDPGAWRAALAEDVVDLVNVLAEADAAIAAPAGDRGLAEAIAWPTMAVYDIPAPDVRAAFEAAGRDGYDQAAVVAPDAPDLPGLQVGKLLRPLTTRAVAAAPAAGGTGLLGVACRLPAPAWLPATDLDAGSVSALRAAAPRPADVATTPGWRRLRGPADLTTLDLAVEGWEATRALLSA
ncbi:MAG TPA: hypothetical protein VFR67_24775 [Pilimelia sp.]|nr:hypothetical protein [Pilimelia sp.]